MKLPYDIIPRSKWVVVTQEIHETAIYQGIRQAFLDACRKPGWNPKTVNMGGRMLAFDYCAHASRKKYDERGMKIDHSHPHSFRVAVIDDHPVLKQLPANAPRSVKHIYRAPVRLRFLLARDGWDYIESVNRAQADWASYQAALK
jgi:hypothetical protein